MSESDWNRIKYHLPGRTNQTDWVAKDNRLFAHLEWLILDTLVIRAHRSAAWAKKAIGTGSEENEAKGRSRGGFGTKIHSGVYDLGQTVKLILTPGLASDVTQVKTLIQGVLFEVVITCK